MSEIPKLGCINHDQERRVPPTDIAAYIDWILRGGRFDSGHREPQPTREWVGLTDGEVSALWEVWRASLPRYAGFAKGIEAKLKEKNHE